MRKFWKKTWESTKRICKKIGNKDMWCRVGRYCLKILTIPRWLLIFLIIFTIIALCYIFINGYNTSPLAVVAYGVSAYTLGAVCVVVPSIVKKLKTSADNSEKMNYIRNHAITQRLVNDKLYRGRVVLYKGMITSMMFAVFKMVVAIIYRSVWFGAVSVYYLSLTGMRYLLVKYMKKADGLSESDKKEDDNQAVQLPADGIERYLMEYRGYRLCGYLMFFLNVAMTGMTIQMVKHDKGYSYPGMIIYVSAVYAFYTLTMSIINLVRYRKLNSPVISAAKVIGLASALMSILALQTAMLTQFGAEQKAFISVMNACTGGAVCFAIFVMAIIMIYKSGKDMRKQNIYN